MDKQQVQVHSTFSNLRLEKQERIIAAAVAEFARQGYRKASINTIVRDAGIAKGSIYQYFAGKEALFFFVFDRFTRLVKKMVKESGEGEQDNFFARVRQVLLAGLLFIDRYPDYYQIYLKVLFEHDVPDRENLLAQVRLFSREYFGPLCAAAREAGAIRRDIPLEVVIFILDATLDRFLQGYARSYLDCGLDLSGDKESDLSDRIDLLLKALREGIVGG